jgi:hypothetical protein
LNAEVCREWRRLERPAEPRALFPPAADAVGQADGWMLVADADHVAFNDHS